MRMTEQEQFPLTADSRWKKFWLALVIAVGRPPTTLVGGDAPTATLGKSFRIVRQY
jgi:hypothetical protein